ncbi:MAG: hypothetical protein IIA91_10900, partial [Chloroflexi bacterium]|nr:hypothetical protein [Chloroflexota bacterium]
MNFTREGLLLAAFLILPGLIYYFVSRNMRTTYRETPSDARVVLDSFSATLLLVALEVSFLAIITVFVDDVRNDVKLVFRDGLDAYVRDNTLTFFYGVVVLGVANVIVMGLAGWFDLIESAIVWALNRHKEAPWNVWYQMLRIGPQGGRKKPLKVRVRLKNGGIYQGTLAA